MLTGINRWCIRFVVCSNLNEVMLTISNLTFQHDNSDFEIAIPNWKLDSGELRVLTRASGSGEDNPVAPHRRPLITKSRHDYRSGWMHCGLIGTTTSGNEACHIWLGISGLSVILLPHGSGKYIITIQPVRIELSTPRMDRNAFRGIWHNRHLSLIHI